MRRQGIIIAPSIIAALVVGGLGPAVIALDDAPSVEEISFDSGRYTLVGDLVRPSGAGPHPVVIAVAGSGPNTRTQMPGYWDVRERFGDAGYAVFSWDKPGSGASSGELVADVLADRAAILADAIEVLVQRPDLDGSRVGLWGLSQAGWVMPMAIEQGANVDFMVVVSGGAEDSIDQGMYQVGQQLVCRGAPAELGAHAKEVGSRAVKATTYEDYLAAVSEALEIPGVEDVRPIEIVPEGEWAPLPRELESFFDPARVIEQLDMPILAVYGELDRYIDPVQGSQAYAAAFVSAGNEHGWVELIPGVGHTMLEQDTGCPGESGGPTSSRYLELLDAFITSLDARG
jgi:pimeloyl-ACP methyl ester carboxylesterase